MEKSEIQGKIQWINCAKLIAILAVIVDHTWNVLYTNVAIQRISFFSVTVFVFLSGITSYYSVERHQDRKAVCEISRRLSTILLPYAVATGIYQLAHERFFDIKTYLLHLIRFDASGPFYFVAFFLQLIIAAPGLVYLLKKCQEFRVKWLGYMTLLFVVIAVSILSIKYTSVGEIYGGGHYLFGGSFLIVFFLGMLFAHLEMPIYRKWQYETVVFWIFVVLTGGMMIGLMWKGPWLDCHQIFGVGLNPPGITLIFYSMVIVVVFMLLFSRMEHSTIKGMSSFAGSVAKLGSYSLYIFLYHLLFMEAMEAVARRLGFGIHWIKCVIYIPIMVFGPIVLTELYRYAKRKIVRKAL